MSSDERHRRFSPPTRHVSESGLDNESRFGHQQVLDLSAQALEDLMRDRFERPMPKRFYETVALSEEGPPFAVLLDERPVKTPMKRLLALPTRPLAEAVAEEWRRQSKRVRPFTMPLTRLCNAAIDHLPQQKTATIARLVNMAAHDMLCYRADHPSELAARQKDLWDPVVAWAESVLGEPLKVTFGILPITQSQSMLAALHRKLEELDAFALVAVAAMAELTHSPILALAVLAGVVAPKNAWNAANVEEDWNIAQWGEDAESAARRRQNARDFFAASRLPALAANHSHA